MTTTTETLKDTVEAIEEEVVKNIKESSTESKLAKLKIKVLLEQNKNLAGAIIGGVVATGLEIISPTGSKTSAIAAGVTSAATIYLLKDYLKVAPQNTTIAAAAGVSSMYAGMVAGRMTACYFPGNLQSED